MVLATRGDTSNRFWKSGITAPAEGRSTFTNVTPSARIAGPPIVIGRGEGYAYGYTAAEWRSMTSAQRAQVVKEWQHKQGVVEQAGFEPMPRTGEAAAERQIKELGAPFRETWGSLSGKEQLGLLERHAPQQAAQAKAEWGRQMAGAGLTGAQMTAISSYIPFPKERKAIGIPVKVQVPGTQRFAQGEAYPYYALQEPASWAEGKTSKAVTREMLKRAASGAGIIAAFPSEEKLRQKGIAEYEKGKEAAGMGAEWFYERTEKGLANIAGTVLGPAYDVSPYKPASKEAVIAEAVSLPAGMFSGPVSFATTAPYLPDAAITDPGGLVTSTLKSFAERPGKFMGEWIGIGAATGWLGKLFPKRAAGIKAAERGFELSKETPGSISRRAGMEYAITEQTPEGALTRLKIPFAYTGKGTKPTPVFAELKVFTRETPAGKIISDIQGTLKEAAPSRLKIDKLNVYGTELAERAGEGIYKIKTTAPEYGIQRMVKSPTKQQTLMGREYGVVPEITTLEGRAVLWVKEPSYYEVAGYTQQQLKMAQKKLSAVEGITTTEIMRATRGKYLYTERMFKGGTITPEAYRKLIGIPAKGQWGISEFYGIGKTLRAAAKKKRPALKAVEMPSTKKLMEELWKRPKKIKMFGGHQAERGMGIVELPKGSLEEMQVLGTSAARRALAKIEEVPEVSEAFTTKTATRSATRMRAAMRAAEATISATRYAPRYSERSAERQIQMQQSGQAEAQAMKQMQWQGLVSKSATRSITEPAIIDITIPKAPSITRGAAPRIKTGMGAGAPKITRPQMPSSFRMPRPGKGWAYEWRRTPLNVPKAFFSKFIGGGR